MKTKSIKEVASSKFSVINKTFLTVKDVAILMDCSVSKAQKYRSEFFKQFDFDNFFRANIPTKDFISFFKIDIDIIRDNYKTIVGSDFSAAN